MCDYIFYTMKLRFFFGCVLIRDRSSGFGFSQFSNIVVLLSYVCRLDALDVSGKNYSILISMLVFHPIFSSLPPIPAKCIVANDIHTNSQFECESVRIVCGCVHLFI